MFLPPFPLQGFLSQSVVLWGKQCTREEQAGRKNSLFTSDCQRLQLIESPPPNALMRQAGEQTPETVYANLDIAYFELEWKNSIHIIQIYSTIIKGINSSQ